MRLVLTPAVAAAVLVVAAAVFGHEPPAKPDSAATEESPAKPAPRAIALDMATTNYQRLIGGPPDAVTMHSGFVVLAPGESVGIHNTENYEEVLLVLTGTGTMAVTGGEALPLAQHHMAYCPPRTEHNVTCTGSDTLRYVYIVANAE